MINVSVIVGSLSSDSINMKLAKLLEDRYKNEIKMNFVGLGAFPFYSSDIEKNYPKPITDIKSRIKSSDGVIIITPEYNRGIPGVLKNAIDVLSRPNNSDNPFRNKKVAVLGVSPGKIGTALAQNSLKSSLLFLGADILTKEMYLTANEIFDGNNIAENSSTYFDDFINNFKESL